MIDKKRLKELSSALLKAAEKPKNLEAFISDILSPAEIEDLYNRIRILEELLNGKTQREVSKNLHVSIAKVSRAALVIKHGSGALKSILKK